MKRLVTLLLAVMMVFALCANAGAQEVTTDGGTKNTTLTYTVASGFTVTIPSGVTLDSSAAVDGNLTVAITRLPYNTTLKAAITKINDDDNQSDFVIEHPSSATATIPYTVQYKESAAGTYQSYTKGTPVGGLIADGTIYFQYTLGTVLDTIPAGAYTGTVTFTITTPVNP